MLWIYKEMEVEYEKCWRKEKERGKLYKYTLI